MKIVTIYILTVLLTKATYGKSSDALLNIDIDRS